MTKNAEPRMIGPAPVHQLEAMMPNGLSLVPIFCEPMLFARSLDVTTQLPRYIICNEYASGQTCDWTHLTWSPCADITTPR